MGWKGKIFKTDLFSLKKFDSPATFNLLFWPFRKFIECCWVSTFVNFCKGYEGRLMHFLLKQKLLKTFITCYEVNLDTALSFRLPGWNAILIHYKFFQFLVLLNVFCNKNCNSQKFRVVFIKKITRCFELTYIKIL